VRLKASLQRARPYQVADLVSSHHRPNSFLASLSATPSFPSAAALRSYCVVSAAAETALATYNRTLLGVNGAPDGSPGDDRTFADDPSSPLYATGSFATTCPTAPR
jgi:hypothetical protein